jgi:DNA-binding NarL/FixJ family response regulator
MKHSIVLVDDHLLIAKAIAGIINSMHDFRVMYEVENGKALIEKFTLKSNIPEIVLLDISMPVMNGFETCLWLKENHPDVLVMALSMQDDDESLLTMVQNGAKGYMLKNTHPTDLEFGLKTLVEDKVYFPQWATSRFLNNMVNGHKQGSKPDLKNLTLSEREEEFMKYLCSELTYKEIAEKMFCSPRTIDGYRDSLFEKFNVHTRVGLALISVKLGYFKVG